MKELSIFVDESGDYGKYNKISPFYITTLVFHEQDNCICEEVKQLNNELEQCILGVHTIHSAPLIRRENIYSKLSIKERVFIFNKIFHFTRKLPIKYTSIIVDKSNIKTKLDILKKISQQLTILIKDYLEYFQQFDSIIIYYDNGQIELAQILVTLFSSWFGDTFDYRVVIPAEYKLFQSADLLCTLTLLNNKMNSNIELTKSEIMFFGNKRKLKNNYLKKIKCKYF